MNTVVDHPEIRFVVRTLKRDPAPEMRHNADCPQLTNAEGVVTKTVEASEEQMLALPVCRICIGKRIGGTTPTGRADGPMGAVCPSCHMARSLTGLCDTCD